MVLGRGELGMHINGEDVFPSTFPVRVLHTGIWIIFMLLGTFLGLYRGEKVGYQYGYKESHPTVAERMECTDYEKLTNCHWTQDNIGVKP